MSRKSNTNLINILVWQLFHVIIKSINIINKNIMNHCTAHNQA